MSITSVVNDVASSVSVINAQKPLPPTISSYSVGGVDDTALDPAGGQTVQINGTGFLPGATITFDGSAVAVVTYVNPNRLTFTSPAKTAGTYTIYVVNADGGTAIYIPGIIYSVLPTWTTNAGTLGSYYETTSISNTVVASGDAPITYSLFSGSLPTGSTLYANGVITGTAPVDSSSTTYSFTIQATDAQLQDSTRSFSLTINVDAVTWVSPANNTTYTSAVNSAIANVTLSATDAAGYAVSYSANALPTGLTLTGSNIAGTPTVIADSSTLLTATAATTNRTAVRTINWSITVANDVYFEYNTLLIPGASTTFVDDASTNNFAVTINGDTKPNNFNPYTPGYYSNFFNGSTSYLTTASSSASAGDFTMEAWIYRTAATQGVVIGYGSETTGRTFMYITSGGGLVVGIYNVGDTTFGGSIPINQWTHIAIVRSTNVITGYINGTAQATTTSSAVTIGNTGGFGVGAGKDGSTKFTGYISNARVVVGVAVYTGNFTPSTTPLTAIANTNLLTSQSNRFIDNSTNAYTITTTGSPTINSFDPFVPNTSYSTYGSGYFDGTGDYLSIPNNAAFDLPGDFTVEVWFNFSTISGAHTFIGNYAGASTGWQLQYRGDDGNVFRFGYGNTAILNSPATTVLTNTWYHLAVTRSGSTVKMFLNGTQTATATSATSYTSSAALWVGGLTGVGQYTNGYIVDARLVKGTAVYTTAFTPPTTPLTAIANTSLLTLQNNQSVNNNVFLDNSGNNFLVTRAGNTTQGTFSPYGGNWSNYYGTTTMGWQTPAASATNIIGTSTLTSASTFTVEAWIYQLTRHSGGGAVLGYVFGSMNITGGQADWTIGPDSNGKLTVFWYNNANNVCNSTNVIPLNTWTHIAVSINAGAISMYINGVKETLTGTTTATTTSGSPLGYLASGGYTYGGSTWQGFNGYISNLRVVKSALYSVTFTPSTTPLTAISGTSLLTCQSNRFIDNSINSYTLTITNALTVQRFSPFNPSSVTPTSYSGYFDGSGDYLTATGSTSVSFGTGDFTIEGWFNTAVGTNNGFLQISDTAGGFKTTYVNTIGISLLAGKLNLYGVAGTGYTSTGSSYATSTWTHFALVRSSSVTKLYINGVLDTTIGTSGSITDSTNYSMSYIAIGGYYSTAYLLTGYLSNIRIVKGIAVYTGAFTVPTSPLAATQSSGTNIAAITGTSTSLLTCQSPTFIDNSTNNFTITAAGNSQPTIQNPFGYTSATTNGYTVSTIGGSGYFDGTGDYLTMPTNSVFSLSGAFTFETWLYPTAFSNYKGIWSNTNTINSTGLHVGLNAAGNIFIYSNSSFVVTSSNAMSLNTWNHVVVVRNSGVVYIYINGVVSTNSWTTSTAFTNAACVIGTNPGPGTEYYFGYISDARLLNGTALYTSNFVPPTAPLTAVQNTSLLTNMTSAGIYDAAMMTTMETVGDAKLSTAISKFGGSSVSFDGTGDYLKAPYNPAYSLPGDFTVETWIYLTSAIGTGNQTIASFGYNNSTGAGPWGFYLNGNGPYTLYFNSTPGNHPSTTTVAIPINTWTHVTYCRSGSTGRFFVNGTIVGTAISDAFTYSGTTESLFVGIMSDVSSAPLYGYLDDLRITKGYARYTSNFTAPTSAFPVY